jgi:hypothetical protein
MVASIVLAAHPTLRRSTAAEIRDYYLRKDAGSVALVGTTALITAIRP